MLKALWDFWHHDESFLRIIIEDFQEMLTLGQDMFYAVGDAFQSEDEVETIAEMLSQKDSRINGKEQVIRRAVLTHLTVRPRSELAVCLVLFSITKDAERIGDYVKSILAIRRRSGILKNKTYLARHKQMHGELFKLFDPTIRAFVNDDKKLAHEAAEGCYQLKSECSKLVWELVEGEAFDEAVAFALLFRYYKRIIGHLWNINSSVVMPVDKMDFFNERQRASYLGTSKAKDYDPEDY